MTTTKQKGNYLLIFSTIASIISLGIFVFFLLERGVSRDDANATSYSADQVVAAVNRQRVEKNLPELMPNDRLSTAAKSKAEHMSKYKYFSHVHPVTGKKWSDFIKESEYSYVIAGENLANGFYNINDMVEAWMNSPSHRENILNTSVDETGVGISYGELNGVPTIFVVQTFGKQEGAAK